MRPRPRPCRTTSTEPGGACLTDAWSYQVTATVDDISLGEPSGDHWSEIARLWDLSGPPLRVAPDDVTTYWGAVAGLMEEQPVPRVLLLGVTPELYGLPWPAGTDFQAADRSGVMIDKVWKGPGDAVRQEDWTALSLPASSRDLVLCDGGLHLLSHPEAQAQLVRECGRVLCAGGLAVLRLFVPPRKPEPATAVLGDLRDGHVANVSSLRMRLCMALQTDPHQGVRLGEVWARFHTAEPDPESLAARTGWSVDQVCSLDAYRDSIATYSFVTVDEVQDLFCRDPGGFEVESVTVPSYELGERCPTIVLRRTDR